jgi:hypothetical protein
MKNTNKKKTKENHPPSLEQQVEEKQLEINKMMDKYKEELRTNKRYKEFFNKFNSSSIEDFIENYSLKKARYIIYGKMLKNLNENSTLRRQIEAEERLWEIQRKKLFDLECKWRAEAIRIPEIEITTDFEYWEKNIENCPFLTPISEEEFEMYIEYLKSEDFYDFKMEYVYMSYKNIKEIYFENNSLPPWFEYYNLRKGTSTLITYPDVRGEKEEYYINIWQNYKSSRLSTKRKPKELTRDTRPFLNSHELSIIEDFIKKYEDDKILEYFQLYESELSKSNDEVDQAVKILKESDETIPIESNYDWKSALMQTARKYEKKKLAEALRVAYNKYKYRLLVGIAQESLTHESNIQWIKEWRDEVKKKITKARELINEPADLNF